MEIPGAVTHPVDAIYPAPALIPAVRREKRSVTEQINVCCFLSRPDRPAPNKRGSHSPRHGGECVCITNAPCRCVNSISGEWNTDYTAARSSRRGQGRGTGEGGGCLCPRGPEQGSKEAYGGNQRPLSSPARLTSQYEARGQIDGCYGQIPLMPGASTSSQPPQHLFWQGV